MRGMGGESTTAAMADRFDNYKKMMSKVKNIDKSVTWEKKVYIPVYRRNKSK